MKTEFTLNRVANCKNQFQGGTKKVLCVCSAGLLRSPTAAVVLSQPPFNFNTRAAGITPEYALVPVDDVLLFWADEIVCMEQRHADVIMNMMSDLILIPEHREKPIKVLNIEDRYPYRDPELMKLIAEKYSV